MDQPPSTPPEPRPESLRERLWRIIFLADTPAAKAFDVLLLWLIGGSVLVVMLETVESVEFFHGSRKGEVGKVGLIGRARPAKGGRPGFGRFPVERRCGAS